MKVPQEISLPHFLPLIRIYSFQFFLYNHSGILRSNIIWVSPAIDIKHSNFLNITNLNQEQEFNYDAKISWVKLLIVFIKKITIKFFQLIPTLEIFLRKIKSLRNRFLFENCDSFL